MAIDSRTDAKLLDAMRCNAAVKRKRVRQAEAALAMAQAGLIRAQAERQAAEAALSSFEATAHLSRDDQNLIVYSCVLRIGGPRWERLRELNLVDGSGWTELGTAVRAKLSAEILVVA